MSSSRFRSTPRHLSICGTHITIRMLYSAIIALLPIMSIYRFPFLSKSFATIILGLTLPYPFLKSLIRMRYKGVFLITVYIGYMLIRSIGDADQVFLLCVIYVHLLGALNDSVDMKVVRKVMIAVALAAAACIVVQYIFYYLLHYNLKLWMPSFLLDSHMEYYYRPVGYFYRPSAFFLEPAHLTQYCTLSLLFALFPENGEKANLPRALWIVFGCLLSTSGMGIVLCIGVFGWYVLFSNRGNKKLLLRILVWSVVGIAAFVVLMQFDFFKKSVGRVLGNGNEDAIGGRLFWWDSTVGRMRIGELLFGRGSLRMPDVYMTGLMQTLYRYGYMGVVLTGIFLLYMAYRGKNNVTVVQCILFGALMVISMNMDFISMISRFCMIIGSFPQQELKKIPKIGKHKGRNHRRML